SFYVIDAKTGQVVFDKNSQIGLAPASTQKIITSVTAFELLGKDYRYKTQFLLANIKKEASLLIVPSGDPTLGSWRWNSTRDSNVLANVGMLIKSFGSILNGAVMVDIRKWSSQSTPDGWIWQDIGNYYGAGSGFLNWR
ncbi:MAG TPA: D-alanyl-D-alanine carboxypeptidase, partial [Chitinophagaceae bacterium]|nr:D-alanyl-D-alanine carboxypeptidase [Chitinophagaceae bacterium]